MAQIGHDASMKETKNAHKFSVEREETTWKTEAYMGGKSKNVPVL
jgi:hypothetical protein